MEKLVLRGIMYGADKIPDSWFDKVPGGFYKAKEQERRQEKHEKDERRRSRRERSRRRRHSDEYEDRRQRYDDDREEAERFSRAAERRSKHARSRSSYDGSNDYNPENDRRDRRHAGRRRTYHEDDDRYGYDDGYSHPESSKWNHAPDDQRRDSHDIADKGSPQFMDPQQAAIHNRNAAATAAASAGTAAATAQQSQQSTPSVTPPAPSYVPYAHIYGPSAGPSPAGRQPFSPPPASSIGSVQPNNMNQLSPPAPSTTSYDYPPSTGPYDPRNYQDPYNTQQPRNQDSPSHRSPSPSFETTTSPPPRRTRSERHPPHAKDRPRGKSLSRHLDLSQHGLGHSAVGAVAGGLVGSGIGKGRAPAAVGAAIGGLGANALGASQRFVNPNSQWMPRSPPPGPPPSSAGSR